MENLNKMSNFLYFFTKEYHLSKRNRDELRHLNYIFSHKILPCFGLHISWKRQENTNLKDEQNKQRVSSTNNYQQRKGITSS